MPGRHDSSDKYRYGFQGQENDNEIKGEGNSLNYKYRMHDPRVGRFFAVDPLSGKYPYYSPYAFSGNRVIDMIEMEGLEPQIPKYKWAGSSGYESHGDFYNQGGHLAKVQGWWVHSTSDINGTDKHRYWNPEKGKWIRFSPMPTRSLSADLDAIGHHVIKTIADNTSIEAKYTVEAGYGDADYVRLLGVQFDKGIKASAAFKILELNGLEAVKAFYKRAEIKGLGSMGVHPFDKFDFTRMVKASKGIYSGSIALNPTIGEGNFSLKTAGTASVSAFKISGDLTVTFDVEKFKFSGQNDNLGFSFELFDISKESSVKFNNGMDLFHNLSLEIKFDLKKIYKGFSTDGVPNSNNSLKVKEYEN